MTNLFDRTEFETFVLALPGTSIAHQWGNTSVGKVGEKIFATHGHWDGADQWQLSFKCSDLSFDMLPSLTGVTKAKYLARAKWVTVFEESELGATELCDYVTEAHRLIAQKLTRAAKQNLGLTEARYFKI